VRVLRRTLFAAAPPRKNRHELVSEAHFAYMQAQQRPRQTASLSSFASTSSLSATIAPSSSSFVWDNVDTNPEASPFESLCHELRRVEELTHRRFFIAHEYYY